jgi:hypothetical protein
MVSWLRRLRLAVKISILWDRALVRASAGRFDEALMTLQRIDDVEPYDVYRRLLSGHCLCRLGRAVDAARAFGDAESRLLQSTRISETNKGYLSKYITAHFSPKFAPSDFALEFAVSRAGVSPSLLSWFSISEALPLSLDLESDLGRTDADQVHGRAD